MERSTREHQDTRQYHPELFAWLLRTRPIGKLIDRGHVYLGRELVEGFRVDVEADIEWSDKELRVIITEGANLRYTTRLMKDGINWRVADKTVTLKLWSNKDRKYKVTVLNTIPFKTPHEFVSWFYEKTTATSQENRAMAVQM